MPISKKIHNEIEELYVENAEKELLIEILNFEDEGLRNYTSKYEELIREYIKKIKEEA